jgi:hypothetical protein
VKVAELLSGDQLEYFDTVRRRLLDIPWARRQEILSDLLIRLDELSWDTPPAEVLGRADDYARLMREGAGYAPTATRRFAYVRAWRLRRKIAAAVVAVLVVVVLPAAIVTGRGIARYQPLDAEMVTLSSTAAPVHSVVPTEANFFHYEQGAQVVVGADVVNHGRFTVSITGFVVPQSPYGPLVPTELWETRDPHKSGDWHSAAPFRTTAVHPGEHVYVFVMMKMDPWKIGGDSWVTESPPRLRVEVLGVHHTWRFPARPSQWPVRAEPRSGDRQCPQGTLKVT